MRRTFTVFMLLCAAVVAAAEKPMPGGETTGLLEKALQGPLKEVEEVLFVERGGTGWHWYETFGYVCQNPERKKHPRGGQLCAFNLRTRKVRVILSDNVAMRDPCVSWDGRKILFSYLKGPAPNFLLYEIDAYPNDEGKHELRQITSGKYDDIEPVYLPDGGIMFGSGRARRWVPCLNTPVATIHRCEADGSKVRLISSNVEHDNTPWVLDDGRVLYTRWEYVMRGVMSFHHLWTMNPDGSQQMVYFGNQDEGTLMIDAKPIPHSEKIVAIFSPWHGGPEHNGAVAIVDARHGPNKLKDTVKILNPQGVAWKEPEWRKEFKKRKIPSQGEWRDPYAMSEDCIFVALRGKLCLMDGDGNYEVLLEAQKGDKMTLHAPRPLMPREKPPALAPRFDPTTDEATFVLQDVTIGRNMAGVKPGMVKKLLIVEELPKPVSFQATKEPQFAEHNIERVIGEVPVEADGSAYFKAPAGRSLVFLALDENDKCIKPMRSFVTAAPGEVLSCVGCHENRTIGPPPGERLALKATLRPPSRPEMPVDLPNGIVDFPRDIQPILDKHCVKCHDATSKRPLTADHGPVVSFGYAGIRARGLVDTGSSKGNIDPFKGPSMAGKIVSYFEGKHKNVKVSAPELRMVKLWLDTGAHFPGTYAALGSGVIADRIDQSQPTPAPLLAAEVDLLSRRCDSCHFNGKERPKGKNLERSGFPRRVLDETLTNLSQPAKSRVLLAPLAKDAGGLGLCKGTVFADKADEDYQKLLKIVNGLAAELDRNKRYTMPGFVPNKHYIREMQRYGVLDPGYKPGDPVDWFEIDGGYFRLFWYEPEAGEVTGKR